MGALPKDVFNRCFNSEDEIMERIRNDHSLGLDSLFRVKINYGDPRLRIVAPFVEAALKPRKDKPAATS